MTDTPSVEFLTQALGEFHVSCEGFDCLLSLPTLDVNHNAEWIVRFQCGCTQAWCYREFHSYTYELGHRHDPAMCREHGNVSVTNTALLPR